MEIQERCEKYPVGLLQMKWPFGNVFTTGSRVNEFENQIVTTQKLKIKITGLEMWWIATIPNIGINSLDSFRENFFYRLRI